MNPRLPILPTLSSFDRAMPCPASEGLPQSNPESDAASDGNAFDHFLADVTTYGRDVALERLPPETSATARRMCEGVDVEAARLLEEECVHKVTVAINVDTLEARVVGRNLGRAYEDHGVDRTVELVGELDTVWNTNPVRVRDWKTGHGREWVKPVRTNGQLRMQALAIWRAYFPDKEPGSSVDVGVARVSHSGYVDDTDHVVLDAAALEALGVDLRAKVRRYRRVWQKAQETGAWDVYPGPHCTQCHAAHVCPSMTSLVTTAITAEQRMLDELKGKLDSGDKAQRASAYTAVRILERITKDAKAAMVASARTEPIQIGEGQAYGEQEKTEEELDAKVVFAVVAEAHGLDAAREAVTMDTSKAAVERAAKKDAPKGQGAARTRELMARIRERNGVKAKTVREIGVYRTG